MAVEVGVRELRARLSHWIDRAASGDEIVVTEHGRPRARLLGIDRPTTFDALVARGIVQLPRKSKARWTPRSVPASRAVSDLVRRDEPY